VHARCPTCWPFFSRSIDQVTVAAPVEISSWYRSSEVNRRAGGAATSQHLWGGAFDLTGPGSASVASQLERWGWTWIREGDHEHVQVFKRNPFPTL
jgi:hypothetical protein